MIFVSAGGNPTSFYYSVTPCLSVKSTHPFLAYSHIGHQEKSSFVYLQASSAAILFSFCIWCHWVGMFGVYNILRIER